jgi:CBS domain-containing protein
MGLVTDILAAKGSEVQSIPPETSAHDAIARMVERGVGSLIVRDAAGIVGIFTERDFLRRVALGGRDPKKTPVRDVMTSKVIVVECGKRIEDCMAIMTRERIRHLPVVEGPQIVGVISIGDLVKFLSKEQATEIRFLTEYITGQTK